MAFGLHLDEAVGPAEGIVPHLRLEGGQRKSMEKTGGILQTYIDGTGSTV